MSDARDPAVSSRAGDARLAAVLLAIDPTGLGGVALRGRAGGARETWLGLLREVLPAATRLRRLPVHITDDRLLGGLDLAATLAAGRPIVERGVLADTDGGLLLVPLAERMSPAVAARIAAAMDKGEVAMERDGLTQRLPTRFGVVALDEGIGDDEQPPAALLDRLACHISLDDMDGDIGTAEIGTNVSPEGVVRAKDRLCDVAVPAEAIEALCGVAVALGIASLNAPLLALKAARCVAALRGHATVDDEDVATAARLVLAPRATVIPMVQEQEEQEPEPPDEEQQDAPDPERPDDASEQTTPSDAALQEIVLAAARAAIPPGLLARLTGRQSPTSRNSAPGRAGQRQQMTRRGRPAGTRRGDLRGGERLNILETLRAAAPWQRLRSRIQPLHKSGPRRIEVRADDFRIKRLKDRRETVTIFVVDASGSSALHRLAEAKGAVELLLADCYVRRDEVALLSFGGRGVELLLPPTRSLTRAKRCLAGLPGGGGTPLAEALEHAATLATAMKRKHQTPTIVVLTDGRPNIARDGSRGREAAAHDAMGAARALRDTGIAVLLIDTSQRVEAGAARFAEAMGAQYVPLPYADARMLSDEVKARIGSPA